MNEFVKFNEPASETDIIRLRNDTPFGIPLGLEYLLGCGNGASVEWNIFSWEGKSYTLEHLFTVEEISTIRRVSMDIPPRMLPIGQLAGGDQVLVHCDDDTIHFLEKDDPTRIVSTSLSILEWLETLDKDDTVDKQIPGSASVVRVDQEWLAEQQRLQREDGLE